MTTVLVAAAWAVVIACTAVSAHRPPPARVRALVADRGSAARRRSRRRPVDLLRGAGATVLRRLGRPVDQTTSLRVGGALLGAVFALAVAPLAAPGTALMAWVLPALAERRRERRRLAELAGGLPEAVDLLALAVGAGLNVPLALVAVARRASGPLAGELARVCEETALGRRLSDALDDLPTRAGEAVRPLSSALVASERYGAPLGPGLERLADEVRRERRRRADEAVRKVPVKLLFPLVTCTLPAFALLTVAPLIASAVRSLRLVS